MTEELKTEVKDESKAGAAPGLNSDVINKMDKISAETQVVEDIDLTGAVKTEEPKPEDTSASINDPLAEFEDKVEQVIDENELNEIDPNAEKTAVQKRIDQLTAKNKALEEQMKALTEKVAPAKEEVEYDPQTLKAAMKKALETQDVDLMMDIMDYRVTSERKKAEKEYKKEQFEQTEQVQRLNREWTDTLKRYSDLFDPKKDDIYPNSKKELDLRKKESLLYQLALRRMQQEPQRYNVVGGQTLAVSDALAAILRKRVGNTKSPQQQVLERKLTNERVKNQLIPGSNVIPDSQASKPEPKGESLDDYVAQRRNNLNSKKGGIRLDV